MFRNAFGGFGASSSGNVQTVVQPLDSEPPINTINNYHFKNPVAMHTPALYILGALLAGVHQTYARVNCYTGGRDFQASADSLRTTFRQVCQVNFSFFPTSQSAALGCYNYDSVSKINFLVRYEGPNSNQGLNAGDCEREFFDIADPCGKGGENKNLGSGFFFRVDPNDGQC
ncbi:hypothetical protein Q7P37_003784 [Cladosporium fusiforme]